MVELEHRPTPLGSLRDWWEAESRRPTGGSPAARVHQLYRRRNVLRMLITRDLKKRYENSYLGYAWTLLEPALLLSVYYLVWGRVGRFGMHDFLLFMAPAMMPWLWFRNVVRGAAGSIGGNSKLVASINLPREIYPLSLTLTEGIEYLLTLPLVVVIGLAYGKTPNHYVVFLPIVIFLELVLTTGVALLMASLATLFRDLQRLMNSLMRVLFYLTPVIYPTGRLHGQIHKLFVLDPLVGIFDMHRKVYFPHTQVTTTMIAVSVIGPFLVFAVGWAVFMRLERSMLKEM